LAQPKPKLVSELDFVAIVAGQEWKAQQKAAAAGGADTSSNTTASEKFESPLKNIPRIVDMHAGPSYSIAISSSGHAYCFGSNDAGQLGLATPDQMPFLDNTFPTAAMANSSNTGIGSMKTPPRGGSASGDSSEKSNASENVHVQTFDSRHNVLLPMRLDHVVDCMYVRTVACGPNHLWLIGDELTEEETSGPTIHPVGYTNYEVQSAFVRPPYQPRERIELEAATTTVDPILSPKDTKKKGLRIVSTQTSGNKEDVTEEGDESFSSAQDSSFFKPEEQRTPSKDDTQSDKPRSRFGIQRLSHKIRKRLGGGQNGK